MARKLKSQQQTLSGSPVGNFTNFSPKAIQSNRSPTTADTGYEIGQMWVNISESFTYALASVSGGSATWNLLATSDPSGEFPTTPYVVGDATEAGYQTIQSAIDAANSAGGGIVYVQPGNYIEDLTLFDKIQIVTFGLSDSGAGVEIIGTHTPPTSGGIVIRNCKLTSSTDVFFSTEAGSAHLIVANAAVAVTNGYLFNLANWTGTLELWDVNEGFGTNDGCINNTGGSLVFSVGSILGAGTNNIMITSGAFELNNSILFCAWDAQSGTSIQLTTTIFNNNVTLSDDSSGNFNHCSFVSGSAPALTMDSTGDVSISNCVIDSSNDPVIDGTGSGILTIGTSTFLDGTNITISSEPAFSDTITGAVTSTDLSTFDEIDSIFVAATGDDVNFQVAPNIGTASSSGGVATGATGDVNILSFPQGLNMEQFIVGAGQTIIKPTMGDDGVIVSGDLVSGEGFEYNFGITTASRHRFEIGTQAFIFEMEFKVADVSGGSPYIIGLKSDGINEADYTDYHNFASIGLITGVSSTNVVIQTRFNIGALTNTDTTDSWSDGTSKKLTIKIALDNSVTFLIDGVAPTVTQAYSFISEVAIYPFFRLGQGATSPGEVEWISMKVGRDYTA